MSAEATTTAAPSRFGRFRLRLVTAMMLVVGMLTAAGLLVAQHHLEREAEREVRRDFRMALDAISSAHETRVTALTQRCLQLVQKARIHAALEDDALDLLYPNARDELADLMAEAAAAPSGRPTLHAKFWRFLDVNGAVLPVASAPDLGALTSAESARLALPRPPLEPQLGYLPRDSADLADDTLDEVVTTPILSSATRRPIAALAVGFATALDHVAESTGTIRRGVWAGNRLQLPGLAAPARAALLAELHQLVLDPENEGKPLLADLAGAAHLVLFQQLNPGSSYPTAYEVCLYSLAATHERQRTVRWQILGLGSLLLVVGLGASQFFATRLSRPVEKLAADSEQAMARRDRAEAALELTQAELQRTARFSSDASHQLKTPIAVFRASLDELLARQDLTEPVREELATLVTQTYRITGMIEDLLLLSRVDEGRLKIEFTRVDLSHLVASWVDDLSVLPQAMELEVTTDVPAGLLIHGERRYVSMILQNLLENARKYNRPGGRIHVAARVAPGAVVLTVGNTGRTIPTSAQPHIFNRFHRGVAGEDVPGHGLGLNLARELARLHGGEVTLLTSADDWTEFEVRFRPTDAPTTSAASHV